MVRYSLNYVSWKRRDHVAVDLKRIYQAATANEAQIGLGEFEHEWNAADRPILAPQLAAHRPVLRLSTGNKKGDLYHQRH